MAPVAPETSWQATAWNGYAVPGVTGAASPGGPRAAAALPSWAVLVLGSLTLTSLGLAALLVVGIGSRAAPEPAAIAPAATAAADGAAPEPAAEPAANPQPAGADEASTAYSDEPSAVPADVIARLEASSNEPLHSELTRLLAAVQHGFGGRSAQLDPALRSYTARMASRFEWNPDTFRVAVTAPDPALADARAETLRRLFSDAVVSRRLEIQTAAGPDALSLVSR